VQMPEFIQQAMIEEEKFLIAAAEYGFNEEERKIIRDYMRYISMTSAGAYPVILETKGHQLLTGLLSSNQDHLREVRLILKPGEDPFSQMREIVLEFNETRAGH